MEERLASAAPDLAIEERRAAVAARVDAVRDLVRSRGGDAAALFGRRNVAWLTLGALNHVGLADANGPVGLFVSPSDVNAIAPNNEAARFADEEIAGLDIPVKAVRWYED